jgi:diguanylate cyclase (GGDEF)-like protein
MIDPHVEPMNAVSNSQVRQAGPDLNQALMALWTKFRATNLDRVACISAVATALANGTLDEQKRRAAEREAHKLVGAVGSFGFAEGSRLARAAEQLLQSNEIPGEQRATQLEAIVDGLVRELRQDARPIAPAAAPAANKPYVLLVDDDLELSQLLILEADAQQLQVGHAVSIEAARAAIGEHVPDVVLLDLRFDEGQAESLSLLTELAQRQPAVPVVVLTASHSLLDRVAVAERGAVAFLQKSLPAVQVMDAVSQILKRERGVEARILVVDDDPLVLEVLQTLLAPSGYRVTTLSEPMKFWDVLEESPPDLLLLDVDMPEVTGIKLCQAVRTDLRWAGVPILFLSAHDDAGTIQRVFAAGADDYLAKPIVGPELLIRIANRLERTQLHRRLAETDVLTGLATRQKATQSLGQLLRLSERHGKPVSLAVIDLDHFKAINDRYGHTVGDGVLRRTADVLFQAFRRDDVVGRWGGEEFIVGLYGMPRASGQDRLRRALDSLQAQEFEAPGGEKFRVSFSAGVAEFPKDGQDMASLFRQADAALYVAKAAGRAQVVTAG